MLKGTSNSQLPVQCVQFVDAVHLDLLPFHQFADESTVRRYMRCASI